MKLQHGAERQLDILVCRLRLPFLECHSRMALLAYGSRVFVTVMTLRAFDIGGLGYMVVVRILFEVLGPLSNCFERLVAFEACFLRCGYFGRLFRMTGAAFQAAFLVAVCEKILLFLS